MNDIFPNVMILEVGFLFYHIFPYRYLQKTSPFFITFRIKVPSVVCSDPHRWFCIIVLIHPPIVLLTLLQSSQSLRKRGSLLPQCIVLSALNAPYRNAHHKPSPTSCGCSWKPAQTLATQEAFSDHSVENGNPFQHSPATFPGPPSWSSFPLAYFLPSVLLYNVLYLFRFDFL